MRRAVWLCIPTRDIGKLELTHKLILPRTTKPMKLGRWVSVSVLERRVSSGKCSVTHRRFPKVDEVELSSDIFSFTKKCENTIACHFSFCCIGDDLRTGNYEAVHTNIMQKPEGSEC